MTTKVIINGRVYAHNGMPISKPHKVKMQRGVDGKLYPPEVPLDRLGQRMILGEPIPQHSPMSPFRAGSPHFDSELKIVFQVLHKLSPLDGWGSPEFFMKRWSVRFVDLVRFVELGFLDAGIEQDSMVRRFRCRDERALRRHNAFTVARTSTIRAERAMQDRSAKALIEQAAKEKEEQQIKPQRYVPPALAQFEATNRALSSRWAPPTGFASPSKPAVKKSR